MTTDSDEEIIINNNVALRAQDSVSLEKAKMAERRHTQ